MEKRNSSMLRVIARLAWPTVLEQVLQTTVSYVDSAMVGRLGAQATAAVGATATVNWMTGSIVSALGIGFLARIARCMGAGQKDEAGRTCAQMTFVIVIAGSAITALALLLAPYIPVWMQADPSIRDAASRYFFILYAPMLLRTASILYGTCLRAAGDTRTPMLINGGVNLINVVLNFFFIYGTRTAQIFGMRLSIPGLGLGTDGAAIASAAAFSFGGAAFIWAVFRHRVLSPAGRSVLPDRAILFDCFRVTVPAMLQRVATGFGYVVFASMINSLGTIALAAHSIANTAESAFYIPGWGMQTAAATLAGNTYGMRDKRRMRTLTRTLLACECAVMGVSGLLLFIFAEPLMRIFTADAAVVASGKVVLRMVALSEPAYGVSIILDGIFQGVGDTFRSFVYNAVCMWGIRILGTFLLIKLGKGSLTGAWACMIAHNVMLGVLLSLRYRSGKWDPLRSLDTSRRAML